MIMLAITFLTNTVMAVNPENYIPNQNINDGNFLEKAGLVLGWIKYTGILVSVVALTIIGFKYLLSSVEGKAEYKKTMVPYVIGCFMLMCTCLVIGIIESVAKEM